MDHSLNRRAVNRKKKIIWGLAIFFLLLIGVTIVDFIRISGYSKKYADRPSQKIDTRDDEIYFELSNGKKDIDWTKLDGTLEYIKGQYDCSDFRLVNLIRIIYEYGDLIPDSVMTKISNTLFGFRYWWDEPGGNSMCYWSENHQILFSSAEYLIGQRFPDQVFVNSQLTGKQHQEKACKRILDWMEMRWKYGFIEFYSNVYYKEDVGAMINIIDFAQDTELAGKMMIIMDLLLFDVATQSTNGMFVSASGRAYEGNRKGGSSFTFGGLTNYYWGNGEQISHGIMYGMMTTHNYLLPPVIAEIGRDTSEVVVKQSNGLDISELKNEGYFGTDTRSMMMQWGMESFTNPEIVRNTLAHIRNNHLLSNNTLNDFKHLDFTLLRWLHLEPLLSRIVNMQSNGVSIQRGNTYTYRTKDYSIYSVQDYHPGDYGDQQHVAGMNVGNSFAVFHTHPATDKDHKSHSPNYWVGYGHLSQVAQDKNVSLAIYNLPEKKGLMEMALLDYTHAWFPKEKFDTILVEKNYAFGAKGNTYCALVGRNDFHFREGATDDLIQDGKQSFWIIEAGSKEQDGSFSKFCQRILDNPLKFDEKTLNLAYTSKGREYQLRFGADFMLDRKVINTQYQRFNSPYCLASRKPETVTIRCKDKSLFLDFNNMKREIR